MIISPEASTVFCPIVQNHLQAASTIDMIRQGDVHPSIMDPADARTVYIEGAYLRPDNPAMPQTDIDRRIAELRTVAPNGEEARRVGVLASSRLVELQMLHRGAAEAHSSIHLRYGTCDPTLLDKLVAAPVRRLASRGLQRALTALNPINVRPF